MDKVELSRLRLRMSCRSADWGALLDKKLPELWGQDAIARYQLAPLGREHLKVAATAEGIDPRQFISKVEQKQVAGLAIKPVTLRMLLAIYRENGTFPNHQSEIFHDGCLLLCEESNESRVTAQRTGSLKAEERMVIAARIAAACVFSNRGAISKKSGGAEIPPDVVTLDKISGGLEFAGRGSVEVTDAALIETLGTALFEPTPHNQGFRWSHQTYAEFLAAWYLKQRGLSAARAMTLLVHPSEPEHRIVPQLYEVAARAAHMIPGAQELILHHDPEVLVRSDMTASSSEEREAAVGALLRMYAEERAHEPWHLSINYSSFAHPYMPSQLRPYLVEDHWNIDVRRLAISLVEDCKVRELQRELADIAIDDSQPMMVRVRAADAITEIGDDTTKERLKPLIYKDVDNDEYGDLRGFAFIAIWPDHISADELFKVITHPSDSRADLYSVFLSSHLTPHLKPADLPVALNWVATNVSRHSSFKAQSLADEIILKSLDYFDEPEIVDALADVFLSHLRKYDDVLRHDHDDGETKHLGGTDFSKRKRLLTAVISKLSDSSEWRLLPRSRFLALSESDIDWLLDMLESTVSTTEQRELARVIRQCIYEPEPLLLGKLLDACRRNQALASEFGDLLSGVEIDSPSAEASRSSLAEYRRWQSKPAASETVDQSNEKIQHSLGLVEEGKLWGWVKLTLEMMSEGANVSSRHEDTLDLTTSPIWLSGDDLERRRIIAAAKRFLLERSPTGYEWLIEFPDSRWVRASQRAWLLLWRECPEFVTGLPTRAWENWGHFLIMSSQSDESEQVRSDYASLIELAHQKARVDIADALSAKLNYDHRKNGHTSLFYKIKDYWNEAFARRLIHKIVKEYLSPGVLRPSLRWLLRHGVRDARLFAESLLPYPLSWQRHDRDRSLIAAQELLVYEEDAGWRFVWRAIESDPRFGRALLLRTASSLENRRERSSIAQRLDEYQLADLYVWLAKEFPHFEDPHHVGMFSPTSRDDIMWWRDSLLNHLQERGTVNARHAMEKIVRELPHLPFLKHVLLDTVEKTRRSTWGPLEPDEVITLLTDEDKRVVQNGGQLLEVLIESLRRLEAMLQGETPAAIDLWNEERGRGKSFKYRPKDEDRLSDYVKRHLESELSGSGIVLNREVVIRRGTGKGDGEITDIHVDAVVRSTSGDACAVARAIIETKGCWNPELRTAIGGQLVGRYLRDNDCRHGLYLVGWFLCDRWDITDRRKKQTPKVGRNEIQIELNQQAESLSVSGVNVRAVVINTALR